MLKRIICGIGWTLVLYFGIGMIVGGIAGGIAGSKNPEDIYAASEEAVATYVVPYLRWFFGTAIALSAAGSSLGILPGTQIEKTRKKRKSGTSRPRMQVPNDVPEI